ncbi:MAG: HYR domain-containing protein, partial [Lutibacter sp.]|nr:HYR domain-containing protein [Lutibacter sp.]
CAGIVTATLSNTVVTGTDDTWTVTYTFTVSDANGNNLTGQTYSNTGGDQTAPTITCPINISQNVGAGTCTASVITPNPTTADNCSVTKLTWALTGATTGSSAITGINNLETQVFNLGVTTVSYRAEDAAGNFATCSYTVTVTDNINPTVTCPTNISQNVGAGTCTASVITPNPTTADNCSVTKLTWALTGSTTGSSAITGINNLGSQVFNLGVTTVTYTVSDAANNTVTCSYTVTVTDNINPTVTCPANISVNNTLGTCGAAVTYIVPVGVDNCSGATTIQTAGLVSGATFPVGLTMNSFKVTDAAGNETSCSFTVTVKDNESPTASNPNPITVSGTIPLPDITVVTDEADNCTAIPTVGFVGDSSTGTCPQIVTRVYKVTDNAGNSINISQTITVTEIIAPIARCKVNFTVQLSNVTGTATITANDVNNVSTDNCGIASMSVSPNTFTCANIGNNTVTLTVTDNYGNSATCTSIVIVEAPTIDSGTLTGYLDTDDPANASAIIDVTSCPYDTTTNPPTKAVNNAILNLNIPLEFQDDIIRWESSTNGGYSWTPITNTATSYTFLNITVTTLVRAVIQVGTCIKYSPRVILNVIPPDVKPTIISETEFTVCLGVPVTVVAQSEYANNQLVNEGGSFNYASPEDWRINGDDNQIMPAVASTTLPNIWSESTSGKVFYGIQYDTQDGKKFAIANGNYYTTLETPIFNTLALEDVYLSFDQSYWLQSGAEIKIEISTDGGVTYNTILIPGINVESGLPHDYTGPSTTGTLPGTPPKNIPKANFVHTEINLQDYIGLSNLRVRFTFNSGGTTGSAWALDNVSLPDTPVNEVIQWTDSYGNVVTTGYTTTITTVTPGVQVYGATTLINSCRAPGDEGTEFIAINASFAYAGENIAPVMGECGDNTVTLSAYDNTLTAQQNFNNGVYKLGLYKVPDVDGDLSLPDTDLSTPYTPDYPGTGEIGEWTVTSAPSSTCGAGYSFSNKNSPTSTFTGEVGTYTLTWTVGGCASTVQVTINSCASIDFDGNNDYVTFNDNYDFTGPFSIEAWIKPKSISGIQSVFSKRDANNLIDGYDLSLNGGVVYFNWNNGASISSNPYVIGTNRWYHIAITFNGSVYKMYIDGIEIKSANGILPITNGAECLLGAMVKTNFPPNNTNNHFNGWMDEFRIWNKAIDVQHLRQMMNQEIKLAGTDDVMGEVIPIKVSGPDNDLNGVDDNILLWSHLQGYYRFNVGCGYLNAYKGGLNGRLRNIELLQTQNAPIPYTSRVDNQEWGTDDTWTHFNVWDVPNSLGVDNTTSIDWNIVRISHNINSGNKDITVLGLISDTANKTLTIADPTVTSPIENNDGQGLWITHYLKLNGNIDLVGESQLVQKRYGTYDGLFNFSTAQFSESIFEPTSSGYIERDQQGQKNSFNYNYWSSPVSVQGGITNNAPYSVGSILKDGTNSSAFPHVPITFGDGAYFADFANSGSIKISNRWIWSYNSPTPASNTDWQNYYQWKYIGSTVPIKAGEGFTMKGTGGTATITSMQNYVFVGKPHSGDLTNLSIATNGNYLIGNPYPSALDANEFILDNLSGRHPSGKNVFNGALYFWDHFRNTNNHLLAQYSGGYAAYTLIGGVVAIANTPLSVNDGALGSKKPERYIPVGQAFFVEATDPDLTGPITVDGGTLVFKNNQRIFKREAETLVNNGSVFLKSNAKTKETEAVTDARIRLMFDSPKGYQRQLLAGVDPNTTNQFDIGYDAPLNEENAEDMFWQLGQRKLVIQGVNNFDENQELPLGIKISEAGLATIKIEELQNIGENITIGIKDKFTGKTYNISHKPFEIALEPGEYLDRFALIFKYQKLVAEDLETDILIVEPLIEDNNYHVFMNNASEELQIKNNGTDEIRSIALYNNLGQTMNTWNADLNRRIISLPVKLATGVYVVQINTINGIINKRIIVE